MVMVTMDLFEALYTTRAMRRMQARAVPEELIPSLLDAAVRAPSGGVFQNWCFIVIRDCAMKAWLGTLFEGDITAAVASGAWRGPASEWGDYVTTRGSAEAGWEAPPPGRPPPPRP
jgi:nitroreductase